MTAFNCCVERLLCKVLGSRTNDALLFLLIIVWVVIE